MAQYYTLDEAAQKLGLSTEEFRRKLATEWKTTPRRYPDGATLRFQAGEIDELSRTLGRGSDADLQLADEPLRLADDHSSDDFVPLGEESGKKGPAGSGKTKKPGSDSDVRLDVTSGTVRPAVRPTDPTDAMIDLDAEHQAKPPSSKRLKPAPQVTGESKPADKGSDFDLSLSSDSSDEFELNLTDDSDEVDIGVMPGGKGLKTGDSGINLQAPADSGISLEKSSDFELALEGEGPKTGPKSGPKTPPKSGPKTAPKSGPKTGPIPASPDESEFELTLDDSAADATSAFPSEEQKDIFETDFELPALDDESGSEAVALEESDTDLESSDFDLAINEGDAAAEDESGSQVVALEEDEAGAAGEDLDELQAVDDVEEEVAPVRAAPAEPAEWGVLPGIVMIFTVPVMLLAGLMSWELVHGMWGYQQPGKATGPIVRFFAEMGNDKLPPE
jgi:hypothetical protein